MKCSRRPATLKVDKIGRCVRGKGRTSGIVCQIWLSMKFSSPEHWKQLPTTTSLISHQYHRPPPLPTGSFARRKHVNRHTTGKAAGPLGRCTCEQPHDVTKRAFQTPFGALITCYCFNRSIPEGRREQQSHRSKNLKAGLGLEKNPRDVFFF